MRSARFTVTWLAATLAVGCSAAPPTASETTAAVSDDASAAFTARLRLLRDDFVGLRATAYRSSMFELIRAVRKASVATTEHQLDLLLAEATAGADGLEALAIAHVDSLMRRGGTTVRARITSKLRSARDTARWRFARPFAGMLVPLGRYDTAVVIDVRSDAARKIFDGMTRHPDRASIEELLGLVDVRGDMCGLQPLAAIQTALDPTAIAKDKQRDDDCIHGKMKAGPGGTTHAIANGGCIDVNLDAFRDHDEYTIEEMNADLEQCTEDLQPDGKGNPIADGDAGGLLGLLGVKISADLGPAAAEGVKGYFDIIRGVGGFAGDIANKALDEYYKQKAEERAQAREDQKAAIDAEVAAVEAIVAYAEAQQATKEAQGEVKDAQGALADKERALDTVEQQQQRGEATQQQVDTAKQRRDEAKADLDKAKTDLEKKKDEERKAKAEAAKAVKKADATAKQTQDRPDNDGELSPACSRLIANGHNINDPVDMKKLPKDWLEHGGRVDPRTVNPNPEADPRASDALGLPICGEDPMTSHAAALPCNSLTDCPDETQQCGCNAGAIQGEAAMQALLRGQAATACMTSNCPPDRPPTAVGITCVCGNTGEQPTSPRPPLPVTRAVVESVFMAPAAQKPINGMLDPLSLFVREAMRP